MNWESSLSKYTEWRQRKRLAITCTDKEGKSDTLEFKLNLILLFGLNIFLSSGQLIDQLQLQNGPNFALTHAMSFHPFVALLCLEPLSREEERWLQHYDLFE